MSAASHEQVQDLARQLREQADRMESAFTDLCEDMIIRLGQAEVALIHGALVERAMAADELRAYRITISDMLVDMRKGRK